MSLTLTVTNNYYEQIQAYDVAHTLIKKGETKKFPSIVSTKIDVWGLGSVNILNIGKKKISGFSKKPLGFLISYQGYDLEYRYDDQAELEMTISPMGGCSVKSNGDVLEVKIPAFNIEE